MSGNNYTQCPRCRTFLTRKRAAAIAAAQASYGKVSAERYTADVLAAEAIPLEPDETLREDFEGWIDHSGVFEMYYGGTCSECSFKFSYNYKETAYKEEEYVD